MCHRSQLNWVQLNTINDQILPQLIILLFPYSTLTLSSDALITSLVPSESPTGTILSEQTLPSFSSAHSQIGNNNTDGFYINSQSGFALPPLENTFNFENVDLEDSPA